ncbi:MAG: SDR family NAD(P)-dependent oxidoreductase [Acidimicrobiia bacterium]
MSKLSIVGFTNLGYRAHAKSFAPLDSDMQGKTVVVTGATGGLGLATARRLAGLGARVAIVGRSDRKLDEALHAIGGDAVPYRADLSLMAEIRVLVESIRSNEDRIDVLINNVGVLYPERTITDEGLEASFATNLAGHFLLTNLLAPQLIESAPARIINVTSGGMYSARITPDDLQTESKEYAGAAVYARTKRGQVILTEQWAERLGATGVVVHSTHPGWAKTAGVATSLPTFNKLMKPFLRTPDQGADTIVWLASAEEPSRSTGCLWFDRREVPTHLMDSTKETEEERRALWDNLVETTHSDLLSLDVQEPPSPKQN